ncbi:MAG: Uma2 family endonuclease [Moorea sp. SIO1F2]|uniref:Uma2 family endonuclease n=1 Tax=unclassified Moorena TaxID=2683338 RepID=UPI0013BDC23C|nr:MULTISPECIES: Uma2 family endonuclease [unclassified Moorena]NEN98648.1 Uma2 family endonuclease [Moorena sp. SIO3I7]NEO59770.1 Uma2 family endonuclease [Moorena sp. SIO4G2]NEO09969.1 Uma2 family endonuclease [Moorena sp. SIO3I8]NEO23410.1 Uma2 family endonuclease [Moorena sp. SIO4A5]NEP25667.1 Uma2 family endonuclease [Moorena sp. SIO3I6]
MTVATTPVDTSPIVLRMPPALAMDDDQFFEFCQINRELSIERTSAGEIIIMSPTGGVTGNRNFKLIQQLANWTDDDGTGIGFDSSTGFKLPNGAERSPDAAWIKLERWDTIPTQKQERFAPICPDFVVELRSPSDKLETLQNKMTEYIDNGAKLGWLIDRKHQRVYVYRPGVETERLDNPATVSGEAVLPGFVLKLSKIW